MTPTDTTYFTVPSATSSDVLINVPIEQATMQQAIDWMNTAPSFPERLERRFFLKQYIGTRCNLRLRNTTDPDTDALPTDQESNSPEGG